MTRFEANSPDPLDLSRRAQKLAAICATPERYQGYARAFLSQNEVGAVLGGAIQDVSPWIEPIDVVLGKDPDLLRTNGFNQGVVLGLLLAPDLYGTRAEAFGAQISGLRVAVQALQDPAGPIPTAHLRGSFLMERGWRGLGLFEAIRDEIDTITSIIHRPITTQTAVLAGCGVTLGLAAEAYRTAPGLSEMYETATAIASNQLDLNAAYRAFLDPQS